MIPDAARRSFLKATGYACGTASGIFSAPETFGATPEAFEKLEVQAQGDLADTVLRLARLAGASYCDVRIGRDQTEFLFAREEKLQKFSSTYSTGLGGRVGYKAFACTRRRQYGKRRFHLLLWQEIVLCMRLCGGQRYGGGQRR
jgi:hypothetical protein